VLLTEAADDSHSARNIIRLTLLSGRNAGQVCESRGDRLSIGRGDRNDLILDEPHVSLRHAEIHRAAGRFVYRDLCSTNGSLIQRGEQRFVLDERSGFEKDLASGDQIALGDARAPVLLRFEQLSGPPTGDPHRTVAASCALDRIQDVRDHLLQDPATLKRMYLFLEELQPLLDKGELFRRALSLLRSCFPRAASVDLFTREPGEDRFLPAASDPGSREPRPSSLSRTLAEQVLATERSLLVEDAPALYPDAHSLSSAGIRSVLCAPLWNQGVVSGIIQVTASGGAPPFSRADLELLTVLAHQVALAFDRIRLHEILRASEKEVREENLYLSGQLDRRYSFDRILGQSPAMLHVFERMKSATQHVLPVLILGETGTGKDLVARAFHHNSRRRARRFVAVNCGAITESLFESEMFGHTRGAFTGAAAGRKGLMEEADGGTAFLDEIGEAPAAVQVKLLRFLQDGEIRPVGSTRSRNLSVRVLAASQNVLGERIREGRFREDLFYRLNYFTIELPPLRERREDIPLIAGYWAERYAREMGKQVRGLSSEGVRALLDRPFPGNVRELQNLVAHAVALAREPLLGPADLCASPVPFPGAPPIHGTVPETLQGLKEARQRAQDEVEKAFLRNALERHGWNVSHAARATGINRSLLHEMMARHKIARTK